MNDTKSIYFQDYISRNVCFGCGTNNDKGLQIKSYWEGEAAVCRWQPEAHHNGWPSVLCGGVLATLIDCHCMNTAMANAYRMEGRDLGSEPHYDYATGSMNIKYLKPTSNHELVELRATIKEVKNRKTVLWCETFSEGVKTAEAEVVAIRVYDSSQVKSKGVFGK